ncbi:arylsulfate sulfotransferase [Campylobacter sputorum bv. paraureolyticus LMG 11764]|uniref:aryl-sulfate sulfotransferase n=1 Tax=Campylobacter sputorum TaxID=206 RepID=UPI000B779752|nr:aryl-sulfate sulfotransferase [Campylobacter sputorum]ASM38062.1 arylsulfate sulfotransferase [Campylobacter sputorum bv. paraureolyticus LMG 11764]
MKSKISLSILVAGLLVCITPADIYAAGGASGPKTYNAIGKIGAVVMNPYGTAPLTAIINDGGYHIKDAKVTVKGKGSKGIDIQYNVSDTKLMQYAGIPIFGLYPDFINTVEVSYTRFEPGGKNAKSQKINETYSIYAPPITTYGSGTAQKNFLPKAEVIVPASHKVKNNLYLMNHLSSILPNASQVVWNHPAGGALEWDYESYVWMIDTNGDIRWQLDVSKFRDPYDIRKKGNMMGFDQTSDGNLLWGMGQTYKKYDLMGRKVFDRMLPRSYIDFSHHAEETSKGTYLLRVADSDMKRKDGKNARTVRDVIVELDKEGNVIDEWNLSEILDPYRDNNILAMDQGAVCLNVDASKAGQTVSKEELESDNMPFGDVAGVGPGRNWAHVNSVNYDPYDDSIIISSRHQSAVIKIGRDKKIKWILSSPEGWSDEYKKYILTPIDEKGKKIVCEAQGSHCPGYLSQKGGFDYSWTQHTAYVIPEKSKDHLRHISTFDNGDSRGMEQPAMVSMKYSRAVEYEVDEKNMTVKQVWEFGKERGLEWYSPITSVTEYIPKTDTMMVYSATAGMGDLVAFRNGTAELAPYLHEFKYGTKTPELEIKMVGGNIIGYRALVIDYKKPFN